MATYPFIEDNRRGVKLCRKCSLIIEVGTPAIRKSNRSSGQLRGASQHPNKHTHYYHEKCWEKLFL